MDSGLIAAPLLEAGITDRTAATAAVRKLYRLARLGQPDVVWVESPRAAAEAVAAYLEARFRTTEGLDAMRSLTGNGYQTCFCAQCGTLSVAGKLAGIASKRVKWDGFLSADEQRLFDLGHRLTKAVQHGLENDQVVGAAALSAHWPDRPGSLTKPSTTAAPGMWDRVRMRFEDNVEGLASASFGNRWMPILIAIRGREYRGDAFLSYMALANAAGWWFAYPDLVVLSDRPIAIRYDERERLHNTSGPAIIYPDGWGVNAIDGTLLPAWFHERGALTIERIQRETNLEARRHLITTYGYERFVVDSDAELIDEDVTGRLWWIGKGRWGYPEMAMVEVVDATHQLDGTYRRYWLHVPPTMTSAREAVAWTFHMNPADYYPEVET